MFVTKSEILGAKKHMGCLGDFVYVFSPPQGMTEQITHKHVLAPTQSRDNPANLFMFMLGVF